MDERAEPRFKTDSATVIEVVRDKAYTFDGRITDVSALGFQLELAQPLIIGEIIRLTVDGYHLFAQVRRSMPTGSHFEIGVERIDQWDNPASERAVPVAGVDEPAALGRPVLRKPLDTLGSVALRELFGNSHSKVVEDRKGTSPSREVDKQQGVGKPKAKPALNYQGALIAAGCIALAGWAGFVMPWRSHGLKASGKTGSPEASAPANQPAQSNIPRVEPTPAADASLTQPSAAQASSSQPSSNQLKAEQTSTTPAQANSGTALAKTPLLTAVSLSSAALSLPPARPSASAANAPSTAPKTTVGGSSATVAASSTRVTDRISLKATDVSWVTACVDGKKLFSKLFKKDDAEEIPFSRLAVVRSGNAGALELTTGKESIGTLGTWGAIRTIKVTSAGHEFVAPTVATNCGND